MESYLGNNVSIWDLRENEKVKIGIGTCRDPSLVPIYVVLGVETYTMALIEAMFEAFEEHKPFILALVAKYFKSTI
jgi:peptidyl-tRNA hydrolase